MKNSHCLIVARAIRRREWIYFTRHLQRHRIRPLMVGLQASFEAIVDARRGRAFSGHEKARIREMIRQGYGARPFCDVLVKTDQQNFAATVDLINARLKDLLTPHDASNF